MENLEMKSFKQFLEESKQENSINEDDNYKLSSQDKKDLKELFETWENLKYNVEFELENFKENNIYKNDIAKYRMDKVRKILPLIKKWRSEWNKR